MKQMLKIPSLLVIGLLLTGVLVAGQPDDFTLRIGGFAFDPVVSEPELPEGWTVPTADLPDLHLVQFDRAIPAGTADMLRAAGLEPVQYIHPNTYIVWGRGSDRIKVNGRQAVRWSGDFAPAFRVQSELRTSTEGEFQVNVLIYRGSGVDRILDTIGSSYGGLLTGRMPFQEKFEIAGFTLSGDQVRGVASLPGVYSVQLRTEPSPRAEAAAQISAGNLDAFNRAYPGYQTWLFGLGLSGNGVVVGLVDESADEMVPDLVTSFEPCIGDSCSTNTGSAHGTHVAGIISGNGASGEMDSNGFLRGLGLAPDSGLLNQKFVPTFLQVGGMSKLITDSSVNGAVISSNSWGTAQIALGYDVNTMLLDSGVRDADPVKPGNQPLIYILAINNGNGGVSSQGAPDESKNAFTIGASRGGLAPDNTPDDRINHLATVTAHGPALDGRIIPHMVAPGCLVDSTYPFFGDPPVAVWETRCGTSMAAPHVSGAVALFVEQYRNRPETVSDPSPALVKAAFLPVAHDLVGGLDADGGVMGHRPDSKQGWGRLDMSAVLDPPAGSVLYFDQEHVFEASGQEWMRVITPADPLLPVKIMLVWTDAPGNGLGGATPAWNNDLDLVVDVGVDQYLGNNFGVDGFSATGGAADARNNAEGVILQPLTGNLTVRVQAANINSDGVPGTEVENDQDFALVCYNCAFTPDFALASTPASQGVCAPALADYAIDVEQLAGYADPVTLSVTGLPAGAVAGFSVNPVIPGTGSVMSLDPGTAVDGDFDLVLHGDTVSFNRTADLKVRLRTASPIGATLTAPLDLAIDVPVRPVLTWDVVDWISNYLVEVATDATFLDMIYTALEDGTSHSLGITLDDLSTYYWRVRATNACGYGVWSPVFSFTTVDQPSVLVVDDDYDVPNVQTDYTGALDDLLVTYDVWDVWSSGVPEFEPDEATLSQYERIVWFSGEEEIYAGPSDRSEEKLSTWLDRGGCLLISSPDYVLVQNGVNTFMQDYLGVGTVVEDTAMDQVTGAGTVFAGLGPYGLKNRTNDYSDAVSPNLSGELAFSGDLGDAGVNRDGLAYRTSFLGFGFERLPFAANQDAVMSAFLTWCDGLPALDGDGDGVLNGDDCIDADPNVWGAPGEVTDLMLNKSGELEFTWSEPVGGSTAEYDSLRSYDWNDWYNATCVASGVKTTSAWTDSHNPAPGQMTLYLIRARNECGMSTLGNFNDGSQRHGNACE